jgi:hypothetical protein
MDADPSARDDRRFEWQVVLDEADYRALAHAYAKRQRQQRSNWRFNWANLVGGALLGVFLVAVFDMFGSDTGMAALTGFLVGAFASLAALVVYNRLMMPKMIERLSGATGKTFTAIMDAAAVSSSTDMDSLVFSWAGMKAVDETDTHYFMWPNSLFALVLPKRVLRNADEAARFAQALKGWTGGK